MGLILELVDELIPVRPKNSSTYADVDFDNKIYTQIWKLRHAIPVAIFQTIDCVVIPYLTYPLLIEAFSGLNIFVIILAILAAFSTIFSLFQPFYYFIVHTNTYLNFWYRFL